MVFCLNNIVFIIGVFYKPASKAAVVAALDKARPNLPVKALPKKQAAEKEKSAVKNAGKGPKKVNYCYMALHFLKKLTVNNYIKQVGLCFGVMVSPIFNRNASLIYLTLTYMQHLCL